MIDVSVIFVSYNTRELTLCAIAALYESTANSALNVEIILVDNASVDGTTEAVAARYPEVVLLPESKNFGFGGGNNRAADVARGQALFFLNTDTECRAGVVDALFEELMRDRAVGAVGARLFYPDGSHQRSVLCVPTLRRIFCEFFWLDRIGLPFFSGPFAEGLDPDLPASVEAVHGAAFMMHSALFAAIGQFDTDYFMYFEEDDLCHRIRLASRTIRYAPDACVMHHVSGSYRSSPWWFYRISRSSRRIFARKHLSLPSQMLIELVVQSGYLMRVLLFTAASPFNARLRMLAGRIVRSYVDRSGPDSARPERLPEDAD